MAKNSFLDPEISSNNYSNYVDFATMSFNKHADTL